MAPKHLPEGSHGQHGRSRCKVTHSLTSMHSPQSLLRVQCNSFQTLAGGGTPKPTLWAQDDHHHHSRGSARTPTSIPSPPPGALLAALPAAAYHPRSTPSSSHNHNAQPSAPPSLWSQLAAFTPPRARPPTGTNPVVPHPHPPAPGQAREGTACAEPQRSCATQGPLASATGLVLASGSSADTGRALSLVGAGN